LKKKGSQSDEYLILRSKGQRAKGKGQRAKGKGQRAKGKRQL